MSLSGLLTDNEYTIYSDTHYTKNVFAKEDLVTEVTDLNIGNDPGTDRVLIGRADNDVYINGFIYSPGITIFATATLTTAIYGAVPTTPNAIRVELQRINNIVYMSYSWLPGAPLIATSQEIIDADSPIPLGFRPAAATKFSAMVTKDLVSFPGQISMFTDGTFNISFQPGINAGNAYWEIGEEASLFPGSMSYIGA